MLLSLYHIMGIGTRQKPCQNAAVSAIFARAGRKATPQSANAASIPQFSMVAPLRSRARLRYSLLHWAYFALLRAQRARFVRPLSQRGAFWKCYTNMKQHCPKASLWKQREVARRSRDGGIGKSNARRPSCHARHPASAHAKKARPEMAFFQPRFSSSIAVSPFPSAPAPARARGKCPPTWAVWRFPR